MQVQLARPQSPSSFAPVRATSAAAATNSSVDLVSLSAASGAPAPPAREGSIAAGIALAAVGSGLIAAASFGIPGVPAIPPGTLLNGAMRLCGLLAYVGAHDQFAQGSDNRVARGALLCAAGTAGMLGAAGVFGHIGGLTALAMGVGGFFSVLNGINKLSGG